MHDSKNSTNCGSDCQCDSGAKTHQANQAHHQAEDAREYQDFQVSLELAVDSELSYEVDGDVIGFCEVQASKALTYKHLYQESGNEDYLVLAECVVRAGVEIAQNRRVKEAEAIPTFNLAKILELRGELELALEAYTQALDLIQNHPPKHQDRVAVKLDFELHLRIVELRMNVEQKQDKSLQEKLVEQILDLIKKIEREKSEPDYNRNVWASGGYLRLAEVLHDSQYLDMAEKIISSDERLILRAQQLKDLQEKI